jgi:hypothetical protein
MTVGIYLLEFSNTNQVYVGQSINIEKRFQAHISSIKREKATDKLLEAYKLYGLPQLNILIECEDIDLNKNEIEAIEIFNSVEKGFNTNKYPAGKAGSTIVDGVHKEAYYTNGQLEEVFFMLIDSTYRPFKYIAEISGVSLNIVGAISSGDRHTWLKEVYPEEYSILKDKKGTRKKYSAKLMGITYPLIISPEGFEYEVTHVREFARINNLNHSHLSGVLNGKRKTHLGWKLK